MSRLEVKRHFGRADIEAVSEQLGDRVMALEFVFPNLLIVSLQSRHIAEHAIDFAWDTHSARSWHEARN